MVEHRQALIQYSGLHQQLYKSQHLRLPLDLMKSRLLDESLSMFNQSYVWRIIILYYAVQVYVPHRLHFPKVLWISQNTLNWCPLMPIVLGRGSVTNGVAKVHANKLRPLVGTSPHYIQSTKDSLTRTVPMLF